MLYAFHKKIRVSKGTCPFSLKSHPARSCSCDKSDGCCGGQSGSGIGTKGIDLLPSERKDSHSESPIVSDEDFHSYQICGERRESNTIVKSGDCGDDAAFFTKLICGGCCSSCSGGDPSLDGKDRWI